MKKLELNVIPQNTDYCYTRENGKIILCPYWKYEGHFKAYCEYLNVHSNEELDGGSNLIWDQIKECGVSYGE